jgi:hypothetical protein
MPSFSGGFNVPDAKLQVSIALPNANAITVNSNSIDTRNSTLGDFLARAECVVSAGPLNTTALPNAATMTFNLIASNNANMAGAVVFATSVLVLTGAAGAGAAKNTGRYRLPTNISAAYGRYIGFQAVSGATAGNTAAAPATLAMNV